MQQWEPRPTNKRREIVLIVLAALLVIGAMSAVIVPGIVAGS